MEVGAGIEARILPGAAVAVFPVSWRARGVGLALALAVMASINFVRVLSLSWISTVSDDFFQLAHLYLWPTLVMVAGLATLLFWVQRFALVRR